MKHKIIHISALFAILLVISIGFSATKHALFREDVNIYNPLIHGSALTDVTLNAAITAIGSTEYVLLVTTGTWTLAANVTVPRNVILRVPKGSFLSINSGITLTLNGPHDADEPTWWSGAGSVVFNYRQYPITTSYVQNGCAPVVPGSGLVLAAFACDAFVADGNWYGPVRQAAAAVTVPNSATVWLAVHRLTSGTVTGWTRQTGTHYLYQAAANQPATCTGCLTFAKVTVTAGNISAVETQGLRWLSPVAAQLRTIYVNDYVTGGKGTSDDPWTGWDTAMAWNVSHVKRVFSAGHYAHTAGITVSAPRQVIECAGERTTIIFFNPSGPGTAWTFQTANSKQLFNVTMRGCTIQSSNVTDTKTGIKIVDVSNFWLDNVSIQFWYGNGSVGLVTQGRDAITINKVHISAEKPIRMEANPHVVAGDDMMLDTTTFNDLYITGYETSDGCQNTYPLIQAGDISMSRVRFVGYQAWVCGNGGFEWITTTASQNSLNWLFENVGLEQQPTSAIGLRIENNFQLVNLAIRNWYSEANGFYFRGVRAVTLDNTQVGTGGVTPEVLNVNTTVDDLLLNNARFSATTTVSLGGMQLAWGAYDQTQAAVPVPPNAHYVAGATRPYNILWGGARFATINTSINDDVQYNIIGNLLVSAMGASEIAHVWVSVEGATQFESCQFAMTDGAVKLASGSANCATGSADTKLNLTYNAANNITVFNRLGETVNALITVLRK